MLVQRWLKQKTFTKLSFVGSFSVWSGCKARKRIILLLLWRVKGRTHPPAGNSVHRHHGGSCCAGCFPTHIPAPVCFMTHVISHTWKYMLTAHPKGAVCSLGAGHAGGACCAMDNQTRCSRRLSWGIRQMQLARRGLDSASPVRELNGAFPF